MRFAILTNDANSYPRPMGFGLQRMLAKCGHESDVITEGWARIQRPPERVVASARDILTLKPLRVQISERRKRTFLARLAPYDAVVVVGHLPAAYMRYFLDDQAVRAALRGRPLILYDLVYLPTRGAWSDALKFGNPALGVPDGGHWGIDRYDWHFCVSVVSEVPFPAEPQPCSVIGLDIDDATLFPEQSEFRALLDFERPEFAAEREVQIEALTRAEIPFGELKGEYTITEIREVYRTSAMYFVAFRESFGLPICEVQSCGGMVATPYSNWVPSHWIKENIRTPGPGRLGGNFLVYDNDVGKLVDCLHSAKAAWDPTRVRQRFLEEYPQYFSGNIEVLQQGLESVVSRIRR